MPGVAHQANVVPEDETEPVRHHQARGGTDVRSKDNANDAPAMAQADAGVALGAAGTDISIEPAIVALMQDDSSHVPEPFALSRRTLDAEKPNIGFTAVCDHVGIALAAIVLLRPIFAGALQSVRNLMITGKSARLLRNTTFASPDSTSGAARDSHPAAPKKKPARLS